mgnify:CR=1 FL=1
MGITHYTVYETSSGKILRGVGVRSIEELTSSISEKESYIEGEYFNYEKVIDGVAVPFNNALDIEEAKNRSIRERAFFSSYPHPAMAPLQAVTAPIHRYYLPVITGLINGDWDKAMEGFITDGRIGNSHIDVPGHDGDFGFGGKCFPKDLNAMIKRAEALGVNPSVMKGAWEKNTEVRKDLDWYDIPGAVSNDKKK